MFRIRKLKLAIIVFFDGKKVLIFGVTLLIGLIYSCEFHPSEISETFIEKPSEEGPLLTIEVTPDMDTLRLATDVLAEFEFSSTERNAEWVKIYFDEKLILDEEYNSSQLPKYFVQLDAFSDGIHRFKIQAFMSTNSGSIAEKLGAENYSYETEWPVLIKKNVNVVISEVGFGNGVAEIDWMKYDFWGFQKYTFTKESNLDGNEFELEIYNPYFNKVIDSSYIEGEIAEYGIKLNDGPTRKYEFQVPINPPKIQLNNKNEIVIEWEKPQNQKNWESYYLQSKYELNGWIERKRIYDVDSTSVIFKKIGFGRPYEFQVRYIPKTFTGEYLNFVSSGGLTQFSLGDEMPEYEAAYSLSKNNNLLFYKRVNNKDKFYRVKAISSEIEDSVQVNGYVTDMRKTCVSPNGNYFSYFTHTHFVVHRTSDFTIVNEFAVPFLSNGSVQIYGAQLSNDLKLFVVDYDYTFKVIECSTGDEIFRKPGTEGNSIHTAKINDTANRILFEKSEVGKSVFTLCSYENNELKELAEINVDEQLTDAEGYFTEGGIILTHKTGFWQYEIQVRSDVNLAVEKSIEIPYEYEPIVLNPMEGIIISNYVHSGDNGHSYVTDIESGNSSKTYPVLGWDGYVINEHILYGKNGRYISIDKLFIQE